MKMGGGRQASRKAAGGKGTAFVWLSNFGFIFRSVCAQNIKICAFSGVFVRHIQRLLFSCLCSEWKLFYHVFFKCVIFFIISKSVIGFQCFFERNRDKLMFIFIVLCLMVCESACNELVSASVSDSVRVTSAVILSTVQQSMGHSSVYPQQNFDIQHRTTARGATRSGNLGWQLKVGPTHRVSTGVPATNGESRTSFILSHFRFFFYYYYLFCILHYYK